MLFQLQKDCDDAFTSVLTFLGPKGCTLFTLTNKHFHSLIHNRHPAWYSIAKQMWPDPMSSLGHLDFNWRHALQFSMEDDARKAGKHLSIIVDEIARNLAKPKVHSSGTMTEDPRLFVPAANMVLGGLDLQSKKLRALIDGGFCERAPLGKGTETVVDLEQRKCWRLVLGKDVIVTNTKFSNQFSLSSSIPEAPLDSIKENLVPQMFGRGEVLALPYCMNIYEEGGFFTPHRDTVKGPNHFGSCVVALPVDGGETEGGELVLSCPSAQPSSDGKSADGGAVEEVVFETPGGGGEIKWHGFFTDVFHEVKPVKKGFRVTLTYDLWLMHQMPSPCTPVIPTPRAQPERDEKKCRDLCSFVGTVFQGMIRRNRWASKVQLVFAFDHKYSWSHDRNTNDLRGRDRVSHEILSLIMKPTELQKVVPQVLQLGEFSRPFTPGEYAAEDVGLYILRDTCEGYQNSYERSESTVWINKERFISLEHEWKSYSYDTGNEGQQTSFMYEHGCLVMKSTKYKPDEDEEEEDEEDEEDHEDYE